MWQDAAGVAAVSLSLQSAGVRVRQVRAPHTTVALPSEPPNDGDAYEVLDADGSCGAGSALVIVPPERTTIRGASSFTLAAPFAAASVIFDAEARDWTVRADGAPTVTPVTEGIATLPAVPYQTVVFHESGAQLQAMYPADPKAGWIVVGKWASDTLAPGSSSPPPVMNGGAYNVEPYGGGPPTGPEIVLPVLYSSGTWTFDGAAWLLTAMV